MGGWGLPARGLSPGCLPAYPISGMAGDQQAALFGQACFEPGMTKNTYGTGSFVLMNVGDRPPSPVTGLLTTRGVVTGPPGAGGLRPRRGPSSSPARPSQWLRDGLGIIGSAAEIGPLAHRLPTPGAPIWCRR